MSLGPTPILGLIKIGLQLAIIGATIAAFGFWGEWLRLALPLALWVASAGVLTFSIWRLND